MLGAVSFFFQAEDGIRDLTVTGVQTCALPISGNGRRSRARQTAGDRVGAASPAELNCISESARPQRALRLGSSRAGGAGSEEHTSEIQSQAKFVCRPLLEKKKKDKTHLWCFTR